MFHFDRDFMSAEIKKYVYCIESCALSVESLLLKAVDLFSAFTPPLCDSMCRLEANFEFHSCTTIFEFRNWTTKLMVLTWPFEILNFGQSFSYTGLPLKS